MADLTHFKPFRSLSRFSPLMADWDELFRNRLFENLALQETDALLIPIDITEDDSGFKVRAQVPGMKKEDIQVSVDGSHVSIRAETKKEKEEKKDDKVVVRECYCGSQYRSFTLPQPVDSAKTSAKYTDGVLELQLPKATSSTGRTIPVG